MSIFKNTKAVVDVIDTSTGMNTNADRQYLLLLVPSGQEEQTSGEFVAIRGRREVYNYCNDFVIHGGYDLYRSQILSEGINFGKEVSLYTFLRLCIDVYKYDIPDQRYVIDQITIETYIYPNTLTTESLSRHYNRECNQSAK